VNADALFLLTDVEGVCDKHPNEPGAKLLHTYSDADAGSIAIGEKSANGRGGMSAKIDAAVRATKLGVARVVIASGLHLDTITRLMSGELVGTMFSNALELVEMHDEESNISALLPQPLNAATSAEEDAAIMANAARENSRALQVSTPTYISTSYSVVTAAPRIYCSPAPFSTFFRIFPH
jgi:glutamate 5-kinase